jgi:hypothetical protein
MTVFSLHDAASAASGATLLVTPAAHGGSTLGGTEYTEQEKELDEHCESQYFDTVIQDFAVDSPRSFRGCRPYFECDTLKNLVRMQRRSDCNIVLNGVQQNVCCLQNSRLFPGGDPWIPVEEIESLIATGSLTDEQKTAIRQEVDAYHERTPRRELFQLAISQQR